MANLPIEEGTYDCIIDRSETAVAAIIGTVELRLQVGAAQELDSPFQLHFCWQLEGSANRVRKPSLGNAQGRMSFRP